MSCRRRSPARCRRGPYHGVPKNPAAWLTQTAKNLALDVVRREKRFREKQPEIVTFIEQLPLVRTMPPCWTEKSAMAGLRLMFACCHPLIPHESQAALALKTLCGFSPAEIGSAFLTTEVAAAKRLTRARQKILEQQIPFEFPPVPSWPAARRRATDALPAFQRRLQGLER